MRVRFLIALAVAVSGMGGCSVLLWEGIPESASPSAPYAYQGRADLESLPNGWGESIAEVCVDGHVYSEYAQRVHAPQTRGDASRYVYADVLTLGLAEVVTVPRELVRLSGVCDYTARLRVEWSAEGEMVEWVWYESESAGPEHPQGRGGWGERQTGAPEYRRRRRGAD